MREVNKNYDKRNEEQEVWTLADFTKHKRRQGQVKKERKDQAKGVKALGLRP